MVTEWWSVTLGLALIAFAALAAWVWWQQRG
jgi:hypothetical protein